jgi:hypothetical protein
MLAGFDVRVKGNIVTGEAQRTLEQAFPFSYKTVHRA